MHNKQKLDASKWKWRLVRLSSRHFDELGLRLKYLWFNSNKASRDDKLCWWLLRINWRFWKRQFSFLPWAHVKAHVTFFRQCFQNDCNCGEHQAAATSARWSTTTLTTLCLRKKKSLFSKPQSIERSTKRHTCLLLHWESKQRPKPPDVNSHRNATRRILRSNSPAALVKQPDNAKKHLEITVCLSWNPNTPPLSPSLYFSFNIFLTHDYSSLRSACSFPCWMGIQSPRLPRAAVACLGTYQHCSPWRLTWRAHKPR